MVRKLSVAQKVHLSPNFVRLTLAGEELENFPSEVAGCYVKLLFPKVEVARARPLNSQDVDARDFIKRSYTVVRGDSETRQLTLDFSIHERGGPATRWIQSVEVGQEVFVVGPGPVKMLSLEASYFFVAADMAGLPGARANLERLAESARGVVALEIKSEEDKLELRVPEGMKIHWLIRKGDEESRLFELASKMQWPNERTSVWVACEYATAAKFRRLFCDRVTIQKEDLYLSSYWKHGDTDEAHKRAKKSDIA